MIFPDFEGEKSKKKRRFFYIYHLESPNINNFLRQISEYINNFTLISPEKNVADLRGFYSTIPLSF